MLFLRCLTKVANKEDGIRENDRGLGPALTYRAGVTVLRRLQSFLRPVATSSLPELGIPKTGFFGKVTIILYDFVAHGL
jgi:hypothetical protein